MRYPNPTVSKQTRRMRSLTCDYFKGKNFKHLTSFSEPGKCPPYMYEPAECPDDIENFCTQGDDSTCAEELKCCYTGCEYDCLGKSPFLFCINSVVK